MADPSNPLEFQNRDQWRRWLEANYASASDAWLILYKKNFAAQRLTLNEATEEALCFGWIDSQLKSLDERRYTLRYTPRKAQSVWSLSNIRRVQKLMGAGRMAEAGMRAVAEAQANGQWEAAIRREQVHVIPEELEGALRQTSGALAGYLALPAARRKELIYLLQNAKTEATKERRVQRIVEEAMQGTRI